MLLVVVPFVSSSDALATVATSFLLWKSLGQRRRPRCRAVSVHVVTCRRKKTGTEATFGARSFPHDVSVVSGPGISTFGIDFSKVFSGVTSY